ncbi:hypothetical protein ABID23_000814 [Bartonella silvatica]|uniref:Secreted protein n=1 Tax=Bartonella silvatica TaxID=357760 RepID=A0ABV2HGV2_9HYPH
MAFIHFLVTLIILLSDSNERRIGTHSVYQSDHLLGNSVVCRITLFGDATVKSVSLIREGPNFYQ